MQYFVYFLFGLYQAFLVVLAELPKLLRNGTGYFRIKKNRVISRDLNSDRYGVHNYNVISTTKGLSTTKSVNVKLHCVESGPDDAPLMLFLHGFPEFWYSWRYQITEFQKDYRVVAIDMRGYGSSEKLQDKIDYKMTHLLNDVKGIIEYYGREKIVLVAHDWGAVIAWNFYQTYPDMIDKMIIMNVPHSHAFRKALSTDAEQKKKSWYVMFFQVPVIPEFVQTCMDIQVIDNIFKNKKAGFQLNVATPDDIESFKSAIGDQETMRCMINYYRCLLKYPYQTKKPIEQFGDDAGHNILMIWGTSDLALTTSMATDTAKLFPKLTLHLLKGISHWVQQDDPQTVNKHMRSFLDK